MPRCTICGLAYYWPHPYDHLWICVECVPNLAASVDRTRPEALGVDDDLATRLIEEQAQERGGRP